MIATQEIRAGTPFDLWTAVGAPFRCETGELRCRVRCECGTERDVRLEHLRHGRSTNCGCVRRRNMLASRVKHGGRRTRLYRVWKGMRERCQYPAHKAYHNYGGRGITVCPAWDGSFEAFRDWMLASGWKPGLQIDRIDVNGNYEPGNCRIVSNQENSNNRRYNHLHELGGERKTLWHWSLDLRCVVPHLNLVSRIKQGWSLEEALTIPLRQSA